MDFKRKLLTPALLLASAASGQTAPPQKPLPNNTGAQTEPAPILRDPMSLGLQQNTRLPDLTSLTPPLSRFATADEMFSFNEKDVKFPINDLMTTLKDNHHEGKVLTAYPDPATYLPLIYAGNSLGIPEPEALPPHKQPDANNPVQFIEPSSETLWLASGLSIEKLRAIRSQCEERWAAMYEATRKNPKFRHSCEEKVKHQARQEFLKRIRSGEWAPDITEGEGDRFLRTAIIQAVHNAKAYYPEEKFNELTAAQQMALTEMVYQMGVNLEEFTTFLNKLNGNQLRVPKPSAEHAQEAGDISTGDYWKDLQKALGHSKWARHESRMRAIKVIAKLDPHYDFDHPQEAEHRVITLLQGVHSQKPRGKMTDARLHKPEAHPDEPDGHQKRAAKKHGNHHRARA
jgi:hypothetical protein